MIRRGADGLEAQEVRRKLVRNGARGVVDILQRQRWGISRLLGLDKHWYELSGGVARRPRTGAGFHIAQLEADKLDAENVVGDLAQIACGK